jgi:hypothetical protein
MTWWSRSLRAPTSRWRPTTRRSAFAGRTGFVHEDDYFEPVAAGERKSLRPLEERLKELGLRRDHW